MAAQLVGDVSKNEGEMERAFEGNGLKRTREVVASRSALAGMGTGAGGGLNGRKARASSSILICTICGTWLSRWVGRVGSAFELEASVTAARSASCETGWGLEDEADVVLDECECVSDCVAAFSKLLTTAESVSMTSAGCGFCSVRGLKIEENVEGDEYGGMTAVTDMGRCREKNEAVWTSVMKINLRLSFRIHGDRALTMRVKMLSIRHTRKTR